MDYAVDFNTRAAIEYFGPMCQNRDQQQKEDQSKCIVLVLDDQSRLLYVISSHEVCALCLQLPAQDIMLLR